MGLDPLTLGIGLAAAGSVLGAGASIMQGQQQKQQAEVSAELERRRGAQEQDAAVAQAEKIRKAARQQQASATASLAASGVSVGEGTAVRIGNEILRTGEEDAYQTILSGRRTQSSSVQQAGLISTAGRNAATAGVIGAGTSLLSGAGGIARAGWRTAAPVEERSTMWRP